MYVDAIFKFPPGGTVFVLPLNLSSLSYSGTVSRIEAGVAGLPDLSSLRFARSLAALGDLDGDGHPELAVCPEFAEYLELAGHLELARRPELAKLSELAGRLEFVGRLELAGHLRGVKRTEVLPGTLRCHLNQYHSSENCL